MCSPRTLVVGTCCGVLFTTSPFDAARADGSRFGLAVGRQLAHPALSPTPTSVRLHHLDSLWVASVRRACGLLGNSPTPAPHYPPRVVHRPLSSYHFTPQPPLFNSATIRQTICDDTRFRRHCKAHLTRHPAHHVGLLLAIQLRFQINTVPPCTDQYAYGLSS